MVHGIYLILVTFFLHLKLTQMLQEVVRNTQLSFGKRSCIILGSQWFLVLPRNQFRPLYHSTWYIFNLGYVFAFSETHPNVTRGSNEYSAKLTVKDLALH